MMPTVLSITDACKSYGQAQALVGASMSLEKGQWLALLGPNGAGKTTMIRAVSGRVRLDRGVVTLLGAPLTGDVERDHEIRAKLGVVPQEIAIYPLLTAKENLEVFAALHGVARSGMAERVKWALDFTGLGDRAEDQAKTFSGGMKRRLNIACGVLHRPEVVLLDEPTVGVDPQSRERIWQMLGTLRDAGASLLLTTHQLDEAQKICDRITIIDHGKTIADGTMDELVAKTVGRARRVILSLESPLQPASLTGAAAGVEMQGSTLRCAVNDVAGELPGLLTRVRAAGGQVRDVQVESPSLHSVFIHLTGRELRE